jgi:SAM-dependent methyltransferase
MCDSNCILWVLRNVLREEIYGKRVLEVGSLDVNGSPRVVLERFLPSEYIGVDIAEGKGVDVICKCEDLVSKFGVESFDFVISTCALEHIEDWKTSVSSIKKVCKLDGVILIIVPAKWPKHDYPYDFWRFSKDDVVKIFSDCKIIKLDSDHRTGRDSSGRVCSLVLVYLKCGKPKNFIEVDLDGVEMKGVE